MPVLYEAGSSRPAEMEVDLEHRHRPSISHISWLCGALVVVAILHLVHLKRRKTVANTLQESNTTPVESENASYYNMKEDMGMGMATPQVTDEKSEGQENWSPRLQSGWQNESPFGAMPQPTLEPFDSSPRRESETAVITTPPRRRSYTKLVDGQQLQEEIIVAEGWKRHTRVYGGGVCLACLESEQKMKMMKDGS